MSIQSESAVVIVGGGHAGAQAAIALRQRGYGESITLIGSESDLPYERPPLSKDYLSGDKTFDRLLIRPHEFWTSRKVEMLLGHAVVAVEPQLRQVQLSNGIKIGYRKLIWATGGLPRRLSCDGHDLDGVHSVRSRADIERIKGALGPATRVTIIGGGYIGLEMAAVLVKQCKTVTVLEALDRVLARVAGPELSQFFATEHRTHGVDLRTAAVVDRIMGDNGRVAGVQLSSGEFIGSDLVIVGIGIVPSTDPLNAAGATGTNGVSVDKHCRTSLQDIYAIGDCALHANRFAGGASIRLESVQNANDQAATAARSIIGDPAPYDAVPWFWSNQYDLRLQTVGLSIGHDQTVLRGQPESRSFSVVYLKQRRIIAIDSVNSTKDFAQGRKLVLQNVVGDCRLLADSSIPLANHK